MDTHRYRLAVDIGGTFTDLVLLEEGTNQIELAKVLTTALEPSVGVMNGIQKVCEGTGLVMADIAELVHATTLVTNAVIERKGARTAMVTTAGFRDLVEMARETSYDSYDLLLKTPAPLVPRNWRFTVSERIKADGTILLPVSTAEVDQVCDAVAREGIESVAICFLNSYRSPEHEQQVADQIRRRLPGVAVTTSSEIAPEIREYERFTTATMNAYTKPLTVQYIDHLSNRFKKEGFRGRFFMMLSNGGMVEADATKNFPVRLIESGPAAGAIAATYYSQLVKASSMIGFDMGGTTAKIALVDSMRPWVTTELEVAREARFKKGSGLPLKVPSVDLIEIGAGGGSIAHIDQLGLLKVGPESASSNPGPVCYGLGGTQPTVTDADLLLGFLNPEHFAGGEMQLGVAAASDAVSGLAQSLQLPDREVARGIYEIVNENMAQAARVHITEKGHDPRNFALIATGGAGPVHAYDLAARLGLSTVIIPLHSGVASAVGLLTASVKLDFVKTYKARLEETDWGRVRSIYDQMEQQAAGQFKNLGSDHKLVRSADMRFVGQGFELTVLLPDGELGPDSSQTLLYAFFQAYEEVFGRSTSDVAVEVLNWRLSLIGSSPRPFVPVREGQMQAGRGTKPVVHHVRPAYFPGQPEPIPCPVYRHEDLSPLVELTGPCLIEQKGSTAVVGLGGTIRVDEYLNLIISVALSGPEEGEGA